MANSSSNQGRGFGGMSEEKRKAAAANGGSKSGGNFKNDSERASDAGKKGAEAQPTEAKRRGGEHSHQND